MFMHKHMPNEILFSCDQDYLQAKSNIEFWCPMLATVLKRHNLEQPHLHIVAGYNSTYPVFVCGAVVIKFFGHRKNWQAAFSNESAAYQCLAQDARCRVPQIISSGQLFNHSAMPWSYIISNKIDGTAWLNSDLSYAQKKIVAAELGQQLRYVHALPICSTLLEDSGWDSLDLKAAARHSSLPQQCIAQIDSFIKTLEPFDRVFVNGDMVAMHVFVKDGHLSGIIDWGDASVADRHYEIGKLCLSLFPGDKVLLKILLEAAAWPMSKNFARQTLGMALYRQAMGLVQHHTFDIFYELAPSLPINQVANLDELADLLFAVE